MHTVLSSIYVAWLVFKSIYYPSISAHPQKKNKTCKLYVSRHLSQALLPPQCLPDT